MFKLYNFSTPVHDRSSDIETVRDFRARNRLTNDGFLFKPINKTIRVDLFSWNMQYGDLTWQATSATKHYSLDGKLCFGKAPCLNCHHHRAGGAFWHVYLPYTGIIMSHVGFFCSLLVNNVIIIESWKLVLKDFLPKLPFLSCSRFFFVTYPCLHWHYQ